MRRTHKTNSMAMRVLINLVFTSLVISGCIPARPTSTPTNPEDDIREAVFRHQIAHQTSKLSTPEVYCLSVAATVRDPDDDFMKRFVDKPGLKRASQCKLTESGRFVDQETGRGGVHLFVSSISRISETEAEVLGGVSWAVLAGESYSYRVEREGDRWAVKQSKQRAVS